MSNVDQRTKAKAVQNRPSALDPRAPLLTQPFKRLVDEGFIEKLVVEFTPSGFTAFGYADARMIAVKDSGLVKETKYPLGKLAAVADTGDLIPLKKSKAKGGKQEQPRPKKTLTAEDFNGSDEELNARCIAVANACGGTTLVGRVRSDNCFDGEVTTTFKAWWDSVTEDERIISLTQEKQRVDITDEMKARLSKLQCPFRGTANFVVTQKAPEPEVSREQTSPRSPPAVQTGPVATAKGKGKK